MESQNKVALKVAPLCGAKYVSTGNAFGSLVRQADLPGMCIPKQYAVGGDLLLITCGKGCYRQPLRGPASDMTRPRSPLGRRNPECRASLQERRCATLQSRAEDRRRCNALKTILDMIFQHYETA
jgi:hypothetical protein